MRDYEFVKLHILHLSAFTLIREPHQEGSLERRLSFSTFFRGTTYQESAINTRICDKSEGFLCQIWWDVLFKGSDREVNRFMTYAAVSRASVQNRF